MKRSIKQKLFSGILVLAMIFGIFLFPASKNVIIPMSYAADQTTDSGYVYTLDTSRKTAQITGYKGSAITCTIPGDIAGNTVTSLKAEAFKGKATIISVTIPDSVTSIGNDCFSGCTLLTTVTLGKAVSSIGSQAFKDCKVMNSITIPATVASMGSGVFYGCTALSKITVESGNQAFQSKDGILFNKAGDTLIHYPSSHSGTTYNIPEIKKVEAYAFAGAKNLTTVTFPSSVTTVGKGVFENCTALSTVTMPASAKKIEDYFFSGCKSLTSISMPNTITTIGEHAFAGCSSLKSAAIPDGITTVGTNAFLNCTGITSATIGKSVTAISGAAFSGCSGLKEFKSQEGGTFTAIDGVLYSKDGTRLVAYPAGSTASEYTIGEKVTSIGAYAFDSCKNLNKLNFPATVKTLVKPVINNCPNTGVYADEGTEAYKYFKANKDGYLDLNGSSRAKPGDVNDDGNVDNADVILLRRYVAKWANIKINTAAGDVNADNAVDNADVILLRRYVAKWNNVTLK